jgi:hypothetical protein
VAWTKADLAGTWQPDIPSVPEAFASIAISSVARHGVAELLEILWRRLAEERAAEAIAHA